MQELGIKPANTSVTDLGIEEGKAYWNLPSDQLATMAVKAGQAKMTSTGAIAIDTGEFTGRSPKDKFTVKDEVTSNSVWWNNFNIPFEPSKFDQLYRKMINYFNGKEFFVRDAYACADTRYRMNIRVINEKPWNNLFAYNMFLRPTEDELEKFEPEWHVISAPGLKLDPKKCGTRQHNAAVVSFKHKTILIAGSGYTGETKKGIFTILNYILPQEKNVLSMHCSA